ncbi:ATPase, T2SS/T4P/T4SS family [Caldicellulosiruptoraceae bacterium PP1]
MIINPYSVNINEALEIEEEKITDVIERLLKKKPNIVLENQDPFLLFDEVQAVINELGYKNIHPKVVLQNLLEYGPLQPYIEDPEVTDIFITSYNSVIVRKYGVDEKTNINFKSVKKLREYIKRVVITNKGRINENEAKVIVTDPKYHLRIVATFEAISVDSPHLHIRKPPTHKTLSTLVEEGMLSYEMAERLTKLVKKRKTIVFSGAPSSGKTTLLSALIREIPETERYAIIQETFEIPRIHENSMVEIIRASEMQAWLKQYDLFELTRIGCLETLNRIIIGEVKGKEAYQWVFAVYSGMNGSMTTVHTNSASETIPKLVMLMKMASTDLPVEYLENVLVNSLDYIVYMRRYRLMQLYNVKKKEYEYDILQENEREREIYQSSNQPFTSI